MLRFLTLFSLLLILASCKNEPAQQTTTPPPPPPPPPPAAPAINLPSINNAEMQFLYDNCDFIDYTFYDPRLPMSISLNELPSIRATLGHISEAAPQPIGNNCKASGRIFYQKEGDYIMEAEFYFTDGCTYFIFFKDGKPTYANAMSEAGQQFFYTNINSALNAVQGRQ